MFDTIILAGGQGTRLRETVSDVPKPLAPIGGIPFLDLLLAQIPHFKVILSLGYKASLFQERYGKFPEIDFSIEESPLGTGGALVKALNRATTETVLVLNGDSFFDLSFEDFLDFHMSRHADCSIACRVVEDAGRFGTVEFHPPTSRITAFVEKRQRNGWINGGVYLVKRTLFASFPQNQPFSLEKEGFPTLLNNLLFAYPTAGAFIDIGTKESYLEAQAFFKTTRAYTGDGRRGLHRVRPGPEVAQRGL